MTSLKVIKEKALKINILMHDCVYTEELDHLRETSLQVHTFVYLYATCKGKE